ncbi:ribonuclease H-like domain-containing protein [Tanacetum coccineum]
MMSDLDGGDLSDVDDFDDLEMIMQQVQSEQQEEEEADYIYREHLDAEERLMADYFGPNPKYPLYYFQKRYRMSRKLFLEIVSGLPGFSVIMKCTCAIRQLAYGVTPDSLDEYLQMGNHCARDCLDFFTIIDCMHWEWRNCPKAWHGQFARGDKKYPTIMLEAVASYDLWIWNAFLGPSGSVVVDAINNLDASNPLHVQNSNNSNSVIIPFKLLGTENYRNWSGAIKLALQARNKYGFVYYENAVVVWKELSETYDKVDGSIVYNLLQKINTVKQGGSSVADYYHRLNSLWIEFDALTKLPKCTCDVKCSCDASKELRLHQQLMKLMQFLMGLDDCCEPVRSSLLTRDPLPEVKDAYNVISREESHRGIPESSGGAESKQNDATFVVKTFNNNKKQYNNNGNNFTRGSSSNVNKGPNPNLNCKHCGKIGLDRCFEIVGFPQGFKRNFNSNSNTLLMQILRLK